MTVYCYNTFVWWWPTALVTVKCEEQNEMTIIRKRSFQTHYGNV